MTAKSPEVASTAAPSVSVDLAALKAMLVDTVAEATAPLQAELATLKQRLAVTEKMTPRTFTVKPERTGGDYRQTLQDMASGEMRDGVKGRIPQLANGRRLPQTVLDLMVPLFEDGQAVQLDLEVERVPATATKPAKTWGDICRSVGSDGTGHIVRRQDVLTPTGWLYLVHIDGIHAKDKFQGITEDQLQAVS